MKVLLIVVGVLFLLLAVALFLAAIVVFFVARNRRSKATAVAQVPDAASPVASAPPLPPSIPAQATPFDPEGTVMVESRREQIWGALHGISGLVAGRVYPIDPKGFYIGRDRGLSHVVIESASVSKRHVWIGVRDGSVMAIDQQSTNGTYLNDLHTRITEARLKPEDTLILSDDVARFAYRS